MHETTTATGNTTKALATATRMQTVQLHVRTHNERFGKLRGTACEGKAGATVKMHPITVGKEGLKEKVTASYLECFKDDNENSGLILHRSH